MYTHSVKKGRHILFHIACARVLLKIEKNKNPASSQVKTFLRLLFFFFGVYESVCVFSVTFRNFSKSFFLHRERILI